MKLYLISQDHNNDYDTYDSAVVIAENERLLAFIETCRNFYPSIEDIKGYPNKGSEHGN